MIRSQKKMIEYRQVLKSFSRKGKLGRNKTTKSSLRRKRKRRNPLKSTKTERSQTKRKITKRVKRPSIRRKKTHGRIRQTKCSCGRTARVPTYWV